ncbi:MULTISPECIES: TetR/AcrR family transcriptional regulator [Stenotrophomonas]|uniref:TetR/AcrR family transcriptional regulator n=1 Tax=Stenotrophomonas TaxID=40323 RepID=UPI0007700542|nr:MULTISPECIES: TetR/AcrR family transcriptional regulator [Stenotrophomonas]AMJ55429.1 TetR family transcriptional regulator [Stenotrophomonas sp. KCTC 12332]
MPNPSTSPAPVDARDERVFEAVRELLATQGIRLSMDAVAAAAGCSKQTLYSRYGCKRELLRQAMQLHVNTTTAALVVDEDKPLREILLDFAIGYLEHRNKPNARRTAQLIGASAHEFRDEAQYMYQGSSEALRNHVAEWMHTETRRRRLNHDDPHFMAELLISMIAGQDFERQRFHAPHRDDPLHRRRWAEFAIDGFLRAFAPAQEAPTASNKNNTRSFS